MSPVSEWLMKVLKEGQLFFCLRHPAFLGSALQMQSYAVTLLKSRVLYFFTRSQVNEGERGSKEEQNGG